MIVLARGQNVIGFFLEREQNGALYSVLRKLSNVVLALSNTTELSNVRKGTLQNETAEVPSLTVSLKSVSGVTNNVLQRPASIFDEENAD